MTEFAGVRSRAGAALTRQRLVRHGVLAGIGAARLAWPVRMSGTWAACRSLLVCLAWAAVVVAVVDGLAIALRALWLALAARRAVAALPRRAIPDRLADAAHRVGLAGRVVCTSGSTAFCAGFLVPRVCVGERLAAAQPEELEAILLHEAAHARRRDPARRLLLRASADVLAGIPLLRWWQHRSIERSELAADRAVITRLGPGPLARAMLTASDGPPVPVPAFGGVDEARVAQLLGDPVPARRPSAWTVLGSLAGAALTVSLAMCAGGYLAMLA